MIPAAVYLRVSKDDGTQTVENQRPEVMQMAAARGYVVAPEHVFTDEASGAKGADERPALRAMLDGAARGKFRAVFVWRLDRLSRDDSFHGGALMIGELDRFNVAIVSHQQTWCDTSGPFRNVLVQFALSLGADERRTLIERTKRGIERARAAGKHVGRPRALVSEDMRARMVALRAWDMTTGRLLDAPPSWRKLRALLMAEGYQNVPSAGTLQRACPKGS